MIKQAEFQQSLLMGSSYLRSLDSHFIEFTDAFMTVITFAQMSGILISEYYKLTNYTFLMLKFRVLFMDYCI